MTLDEAIKHAEEVAEKFESLHERYENMDDEDRLLFRRVEENECKNCAKEHRQLANWLKELKQLREQEPCEDIEIPNGATNGDMIKTIFPNIEIEGIGGEIKCIATQNGTSYFALDWWNAPYNKGTTNGDN